MNAEKSCNVLILTGFLGSGKTTMLLRLVRYLKEKHGADFNIAILENEIGATSVDADIIGEAGYSVTNMLSGCVCCTLMGQLVPAVQKIQQDFNPDLVILEATGLAEPQIMADTLARGANITSRIVTLVDAVRWPRIVRALQLLLERQVGPAAVICLNKVDQLEEQDIPPVEASVREYNSTAPLLRCSATQELDAMCFETILGGIDD